jgi:hypothetical protein
VTIDVRFRHVGLVFLVIIKRGEARVNMTLTLEMMLLRVRVALLM